MVSSPSPRDAGDFNFEKLKSLGKIFLDHNGGREGGGEGEGQVHMGDSDNSNQRGA